jgi:hypothetical protein
MTSSDIGGVGQRQWFGGFGRGEDARRAGGR